MNSVRQTLAATPLALRTLVGTEPVCLSIVTPHNLRGPMPTSEQLNAWAEAVALTGDRTAFAALFKHFAPRVKSYLIRLGTPPGLAEELAQEAMVLVWRKAALFDAGRASASTWVFTIARNLRVDHFRRLAHRTVVDDESQTEELPDPAPLPEEHLLARQREAGVRRALAKLSAEQADVLRLSFFEDRPHAQIAIQLGLPLGTVKSRVRLAIQRLRRVLDDIGGLEP